MFADTYIMRIVLVNPGPRFQPVTTTTGSPAFMKPRPLPNWRPNCTLASTSFSQSSDTIPAVTNLQYNFQLNDDTFFLKEQNEGITTQKLTLPACSKRKKQAHHAVYMHVPFSGLDPTDQFPQHGMNVSLQLMSMCYGSMTNVKASGDEFFTLS